MGWQFNCCPNKCDSEGVDRVRTITPELHRRHVVGNREMVDNVCFRRVCHAMCNIRHCETINYWI